MAGARLADGARRRGWLLLLWGLMAAAALALAPPSALAKSPPDPVTAVSVARADGTLTARWDAPSGATRYHVTYSSTGGASWLLAALNHAGTSITIKVENTKTYLVGVRARNADGDSGWRNSPPAAPYNPAPPPAPPPPPTLTTPTGLSAAAGDKSVTLRWNNPQNSSITGYEYRSRAAPPAPGWGAWTAIPGSGAATTSHTITGLTNGTEYRFKIRAVNGGGTSLPAPAASPWYAAAVPALLAAPSYVTLTRADGTVTATWDAVSDAESYHVGQSTDLGATWHRQEVYHTATTLTFAADNALTYIVAVKSVIGKGAGEEQSAWRDSAPIAPFVPPPPVPSAPANLAVAPGAGFLDVTWDASTHATGYDVRVKVENAADWTDAAGNLAATSYRYTTSDTIDYVAVRARNASGTSAWAEVSRLPPNELMATYTGESVNSASALGGASGASAAGASAQSGASGQSQLAAPTWGTITRDINRLKAEINLNWPSVDFAGGYNLACTDTGGWHWHACGWKTASNTVSYASVSSTQSRPVTVTHYHRKAGEGPHTPGTYPLRMNRHYQVAIRTVNSNPNDASPWTNSPNITPIFFWLYDFTFTRSPGQIAMEWTPNLFTTGYEVGCATFDPNVPYSSPTYAPCATLTNQDDTAAKHSLTLSDWTVGGATHTVDDAKHYDIRVCSTNATGRACYLAPIITPYVPPSLTASNVTVNSATLTIANHTGDWHVKKTAPTAGTCSSAISTTTHNLSGLNAGTWHTYKAYSDANCSTANELAAEVFSTAVTASNHDTADTTTTTIGSSSGTLWQTGQAFTTGSNGGGYTLSSITGRFAAVSGAPGNIVVKLHAASGTNPGAELATLSGANPTTAGAHAYTCSGSGCALAADTTYLVVMSAPDATASNSYHWYRTSNNTETLAPSSNGWSIANGAVAKSGANAWYTIGSVAQIKVAALPKPGFTASGVTGAAATLTLTGHDGDWWLKKTAPTPAGTCTAGESDYSHALSSLTAGTQYTYKAYSDSACSTANEIRSVTFATPVGAPTNISVGNSSNNGVHRIYQVSWSKPANTQASDTFAYELQCTNQGVKTTDIWDSCGTHNINATANQTMSRNVQHGVSGGLFYYVRVRTVKNSVYSAWVIQKTQYGT